MFDLPEAGRYRLQRPPLALALVQVHFPIVGRLHELGGITPVQERLQNTFPYMERLQIAQLSVAIGPGGPIQPQQSETTVAWKFSDDAGWALVVEPGSASISVGPMYESVEDLVAHVTLMLSSLHDAAGVARCDRIGVRYVNVAELPPGEPEQWTRWFRPELTGWIATAMFADGTTVDSSISQTATRAGPTGDLAAAVHDVQAIIRHGLIPAGTTIPVASVTPLQPIANAAFILDMDVSTAGPQPFDVERLGQQFRAFHGQIDRFFRWSLAPGGEAHFGLVNRD